MSTFGHKLRHERESRNTRIQEVSAQTNIGLDYLEALENNDFDALPGPRGFGKLYIRAYADMLGFDPQSLIEAFEQERRKQSKTDDDGPPPRKQPRIKRISYVPPARESVEPEPPPAPIAEPEAAVEPETVAPVPVDVPQETIEPAVVVHELRKRRGVWIVVAALGATTLLIVAFVALGPKSADPPITTVLPDTPDTTPAPELTAAPILEPAVATPPATVVAGDLHITESAVGTGVVDHRLVGRGTRFEEGSTAYFFSRAIGGAPGQTFRHVWLHEGRVIQSIELPVGSSNWRTYSTKTLRKRGNWSVEARSADGRVLARADFTCEAP